MKEKSNKNLLSVFNGLNSSLKSSLGALDSPLKLALAVLVLAKERANVDYLSVDDISAILENMSISVTPAQLRNALAKAGNRIIRKKYRNKIIFKVTIKGRQEIEPLIEVGNICIFYVDGKKPRTARLKLQEILVSLKGSIRICDPYYGLRTLEVFDMLPNNSSIMFLTVKTNEDKNRLKGPIQDFMREKSNIKLRIYNGSIKIHDRYVLTDDSLLIIGHGLKDIGSKESFIITIPKEVAPDLLNQIKSVFDDRWAIAEPFQKLASLNLK